MNKKLKVLPRLDQNQEKYEYVVLMYDKNEKEGAKNTLISSRWIERVAGDIFFYLPSNESTILKLAENHSKVMPRWKRYKAAFIIRSDYNSFHEAAAHFEDIQKKALTTTTKKIKKIDNKQKNEKSAISAKTIQIDSQEDTTVLIPEDQPEPIIIEDANDTKKSKNSNRTDDLEINDSGFNELDLQASTVENNNKKLVDSESSDEEETIGRQPQKKKHCLRYSEDEFDDLLQAENSNCFENLKKNVDKRYPLNSTLKDDINISDEIFSREQHHADLEKLNKSIETLQNNTIGYILSLKKEIMRLSKSLDSSINKPPDSLKWNKFLLPISNENALQALAMMLYHNNKFFKCFQDEIIRFITVNKLFETKIILRKVLEMILEPNMHKFLAFTAKYNDSIIIPQIIFELIVSSVSKVKEISLMEVENELKRLIARFRSNESYNKKRRQERQNTRFSRYSPNKSSSELDDKQGDDYVRMQSQNFQQNRSKNFMQERKRTYSSNYPSNSRIKSSERPSTSQQSQNQRKRSIEEDREIIYKKKSYQEPPDENLYREFHHNKKKQSNKYGEMSTSTKPFYSDYFHEQQNYRRQESFESLQPNRSYSPNENNFSSGDHQHKYSRIKSSHLLEINESEFSD